MTQLGISISAERVLLWLGVRLLPTSTCTPMWAWRHTSTMQSQSLLCLVTTSPPCLHVTAWWSRWSSALPGHKEHWEPPEVSKPSHHFKATWKMGAVKCSPRPSEAITESQEAAKGDETESRLALSATDERFSSRLNWLSSSFSGRAFWLLLLLLLLFELYCIHEIRRLILCPPVYY